MSVMLNLDEQLAHALAALAQQQNTDVADFIQRTLRIFVSEAERQAPPRYSFIGIGHSRRHDLSLRAEDILNQGANRREGWSLS